MANNDEKRPEIERILTRNAQFLDTGYSLLGPQTDALLEINAAKVEYSAGNKRITSGRPRS